MAPTTIRVTPRDTEGAVLRSVTPTLWYSRTGCFQEAVGVIVPYCDTLVVSSYFARQYDGTTTVSVCILALCRPRDRALLSLLKGFAEQRWGESAHGWAAAHGMIQQD